MDEKRTGNAMTALMEVSLSNPKYFDGFANAIRGMDTIVSCYYQTGEFDLLLKICCESGDELEQIHRDIMSLDGVSDTRTHVVLKNVKKYLFGHPEAGETIKTEEGKDMSDYLRCWAEISLSAIGHNIEEVRKRLAPGVRLLAVIKADAYGHGAVRVGKYLEDRVNYFAVATLEEAVELRENGIRLPILILGYTSPSQYEDLVAFDITQTIYSRETAELLDREAANQGKKAGIHIALDTGMTRIGFQVTEEDADVIAAIGRLPHLKMEGLFYTFCMCRSEG